MNTKGFACILCAAAVTFAPLAEITASAKQTFSFIPEYEVVHEYDNGYSMTETKGNYYELSPDTSDIPEMPDELKNREPKRHVLKRNEGHELELRPVLIMPGDTFEIAPDITDDEIFTVSLKGRDDIEIKRGSDIWEEHLDYAPEKYGIEVKGSVDAVEYEEYTPEGGKVTEKFFKAAVNNLNCPIILGTGARSSEPFAFSGDHVQTVTNTEIAYTVLSPYYAIAYRFSNDESDVSYRKFDSIFWPASGGKFENLNFPDHYWLTDTPYTLKIPSARFEGAEYTGWYGRAAEDEQYHSYDSFCQYGARIGEQYTEFTVCWTPYLTLPEYAMTSDDLFHYYGDSNFFNAGDLILTPIFDGNKRTILFDANGGTVKGCDKWLIEVNEVTREETPRYGENGESRIPDDGDFGFDINDYVPVKEGDTFLGWCARPSTLYTSFVTKDSTVEAYRYFWEDDEFGTFTDKFTRQKLYAKWAGETDEAFEKNGWKLGDDGTLRILNDDGADNWNEARKSDPSLAPRVKAVELGFKDEIVENIPDRCFEGCTALTSLEFGENTYVGEAAFAGCTNLRDVTFNSEPSRWGGTFYAFCEADMNITLHVPDEYLDSYKDSMDGYAYLLEKPDKQRYALSINGEVFTDKKLQVQCGDGTASFDPKTNTLTLRNAVLHESLTPHCLSPYDYSSSADDGFYSSYEPAAIISGLDKLTIVVEGTVDVNTTVSSAYGASKEDLPKLVRAHGDLEIKGGTLKSTKEDLSFYYKDPETMDFKEYVGPGKVGADVFGDLTLTGIHTERLYANISGDVLINDSTMLGGQIIADGSIAVNNSSIKEFNAPKGDTQLGTELPAVSSKGRTSSYTSCTLRSILISAGNASDSLTFKNCDVMTAYTINGGESTKMTVDNTSLEAYSGQAPVTNIPEKNITVINGEIEQGKWNETNVFILKAAGGEPEPVPTSKGIYGDVDGDGEITASDALTILRASAGLEEFTSEQFVVADIDLDSIISANDALSVLRNSAGMAGSDLVGKPVTS